jgi:hypothetical protein
VVTKECGNPRIRATCLIFLRLEAANSRLGESPNQGGEGTPVNALGFPLTVQTFCHQGKQL